MYTKEFENLFEIRANIHTKHVYKQKKINKKPPSRFIRAPHEMRMPYSNHPVRLSVRPSTSSFPDDKSIANWQILIKVNMFIYHGLRKNPIDFGVNRSKVKITLTWFAFFSQIHFRMIYGKLNDLFWSEWVCIMPFGSERPLLILGSQGQRSRSIWPNLHISDFQLIFHKPISDRGLGCCNLENWNLYL